MASAAEVGPREPESGHAFDAQSPVCCQDQVGDVLDRRKTNLDHVRNTLVSNGMLTARTKQCQCSTDGINGMAAHRLQNDNVAVFCCCTLPGSVQCNGTQDTGDNRTSSSTHQEHLSRPEKRAVVSPGETSKTYRHPAGSALDRCDGLASTSTSVYREGPIQRGFRSLHLAEKEDGRHAQKLRSPFRRSLFHGVPPTIYFYTEANQVLAMPPSIRKQLRWKLSSITPLLIRQTVSRSGFRLTKQGVYWNGMWDKHINCSTFGTIKNYQKVNHFPGSFNLGRKDRLWQNVCRMRRLHGSEAFRFLPDTFLLPHDLRALKVAWLEEGTSHCWIVKPPASARGSGVHVVHRWAQISKKQPLIVQRYIRNPYLINGTKFDLRLYALVTSFHPLKVYVFEDGLVRFASVQYSYDPEDLADRFMHLTNYSINKKSATYSSNTDSNQCQGHKWSIKALRGYLENLGIDFAKVWDQMIEIIIKTFVCCEAPINRVIEKHTSSRYTCYELFGFDVLLDEDLTPWLLEVNISPSLRSSTPVDWDVKSQVVKDLLNIVGYQIPQKPPDTSVLLLCGLGKGDTESPQLSQVLHMLDLSPEEAEKHQLYEGHPEDDDILDDLTADDIRVLIQSEDELARRGGFERVFPTESTRPLLELTVRPRYYNLLLAAWEECYGQEREKGVKLLQNLCLRNFHLKTPPGTPKEDCNVQREHQEPPPPHLA